MPVTTSAIRVAIGAALGNGETYKSIADHTGIHRKTISRLDAGEDVELRISQLETLHGFLSDRQLPILVQPKISAAIAASDELQVLVSVYRDSSDGHRRLCSPWDVLAADRIRTPLESGHLPGRTVLKTVPNDLPLSGLAEPGGEGISRVCIGSPRATSLFDTFATRLSLFGAARDRDTISMPFRFYWRDYESKSPFVAMSAELPAKLRQSARFKRARAALLFDDHREPLLEISNLDDPSLKEFCSYAVVMSRWVSERSIWSCISGLTGPATEGAARRFLDLDFAIPRPKSAEELEQTPLAVHFFKLMMSVPATLEPHDDLRALQVDSIEQIGGTLYLYAQTGAR